MTNNHSPAPQPLIALFMGVSGAGKSTLGAAVAAELGWPFYEGDDFHPESNVAKMAAGMPLTDADREPWLARLHDLIADHLDQGEPAVIACSALKKSYREQLRAGNEGLVFIYLRGDRQRIGRRLAARRDHYMPADLLDSQFADLQEPEPDEAIVVDIDTPAGEVVRLLRSRQAEGQRSRGTVGTNRLLDVERIDEDVEQYLGRWGQIFWAFRQQDSSCVSYGVWLDDRRWFVKYSSVARGIAGLRRASQVHKSVDHPALARLHNSFETPDGLALVYEWLTGSVLYDYTTNGVGRDDPAGAHARFRSLPADRILAALDTIYDAHLALAEAGFVAVDSMTGASSTTSVNTKPLCVIWTNTAPVHLCWRMSGCQAPGASWPLRNGSAAQLSTR